jgi:class 3 adenylate cyclase
MAQGSGSVMQTFLFADLSGFTALTEAHGDEQAADLVGGFCVAVRGLLAAHQAQEVKSIGDALMLRTGDAGAAIRLGLCILHDVGAQHGFPLVRVGMRTPAQPSSAGATGSGPRSIWRPASRPLRPGMTPC